MRKQNGLGLSNEQLFIIIGQGAAKLWCVKVGGPKKIDPRPIQTPFYQLKEQKARQFSWSFICGNGTIFDQQILTCNYPQDSLPCDQAEAFYNLVEFGKIDDNY